MSFEIREYRDRDLHALRILVGALHEAMRVLDPSLPPADEIIDTYFEHLARTSESSGGTFYVAEAGGEMVGYVCVFGRVPPSDPDEPPEPGSFIADLYVVPSFQGHGVGKALMEQAEEHARLLGVATVDLKVLASNQQALTFYEALGYEPRVLELRKVIAHEPGGRAS